MSATDASFGVTLLWTLVATAVVAAVAWFALGLLRRVLPGGGGGGGGALGRAVRARDPGRRLRIVQSLPLGTRERVVLIEDGEREYLLGVAAGGVRLLASHRVGERGTEGGAAGAAHALDRVSAPPPPAVSPAAVGRPGRGDRP